MKFKNPLRKHNNKVIASPHVYRFAKTYSRMVNANRNAQNSFRGIWATSGCSNSEQTVIKKT